MTMTDKARKKARAVDRDGAMQDCARARRRAKRAARFGPARERTRVLADGRELLMCGHRLPRAHRREEGSSGGVVLV